VARVTRSQKAADVARELGVLGRVATSAIGIAIGLAPLPGCGGLAADGPTRSGSEPEASLLDRTLTAMAEDLESVAADQRRFMRYVTVSHLPATFDDRSDRAETAASSIEGAREVRRLSVTKLVNSTSTESVISVPIAVGRERLYQRIDLRLYDWQRPARVEGQAYRNGWEAIVARARHAVELEGPAAERLMEMADARVPWLMADDFVATLSSGEVYYALLQLPATLSELQADLMAMMSGPPIERYRAGMASSGLSFNPRMVERWGNAQGSFWQALDFAEAERGQTIFSNPLVSEADATEVIFSLPNGLRGYALADAAGQRVPVSSLPTTVITDPSERDGVMRNAASCFSCHNGGLLPFDDQVRERIPELSPELADPDLLLMVFPEPIVLDQLIREDDARYFAALGAAGVPAGIEDPISRVYRGFWEEIGLRQAAGELFVDPGVLREELSRLPDAIASLGVPSARVPRTAFSGAYREALCRLHAASENRPSGC
jgi:hypothetical protein